MNVLTLARDPFFLLSALFVLAVLAVAYGAESLELAIYALSFWHYLVYALAIFWRKISHERFIRDGVLLKAVSLAAFVLVLWFTVPNIPSLIVMAIGFTFNISAARALGTSRTYYGYELGVLPPKRVTSFPYSLPWVRHPMLVGNTVAYAGTLLDDTFRQDWWQLGVLHVVLNFAIILIEAYGSENRSAGWIAAIGGLVAGGVLLLVGFWDVGLYAFALTVISALFGIVIIRRYA